MRSGCFFVYVVFALSFCLMAFFALVSGDPKVERGIGAFGSNFILRHIPNHWQTLALFRLHAAFYKTAWLHFPHLVMLRVIQRSFVVVLANFVKALAKKIR